MDAKLIREIRRNLDTKPTDELIQIYRHHNEEEWSRDAFEAIRQILIARGEAIPKQERAEAREQQQEQARQRQEQERVRQEQERARVSTQRQREERVFEGKTPYEILGVDNSRDGYDEINSRYKKTIFEYHEDMVATKPVEFRNLAKKASQEINAAWETIKRDRGWDNRK